MNIDLQKQLFEIFFQPTPQGQMIGPKYNITNL